MKKVLKPGEIADVMYRCVGTGKARDFRDKYPTVVQSGRAVFDVLNSGCRRSA